MPSINNKGWGKHLSCGIFAAWAIAKKDMLIYYLKPNSIVSGIFFPLLMFLVFAYWKDHLSRHPNSRTYLDRPPLYMPVLVISMILIAFCFATLGTLFAAYPIETAGEVMSMLNTVRLPLIFISGIFVPISVTPKIGQKIALISPFTYGNDVIEYAYTGKSLLPPLLDVVMLMIFILIFQITTRYLYKKFNE